MKKSELLEKLKDTADDADIDELLPIKEVEKETKLYTFTPEQFNTLCETAFKKAAEDTKKGGKGVGEVFI